MTERNNEWLVGAVAEILRPDHGDGEGDQRVDEFRMRAQDAGYRQRQREAVADGEAGHHEQEVADAARDQHQAEHERHVIDAGEDVHHAHLQKGEEAGVLQRAQDAGAGVESLLVLGDQPLDEGAVIGLDLGEIGMGLHQLEPGRGMHLDVVVAGAFEGELVAPIAGRGCDLPRAFGALAVLIAR